MYRALKVERSIYQMLKRDQNFWITETEGTERHRLS